MEIKEKIIKYSEIKEYFKPFDEANRPAYIAWEDFAIVNNVGFKQFLYEYLVAGHSMRPDKEALEKAQDVIKEIGVLIKEYWDYIRAGGV